MHVDHIKPRSKYPDLELSRQNLQVLCEDCNLGKSNKYEDDWRNSDTSDSDSWFAWNLDQTLNTYGLEKHQELLKEKNSAFVESSRYHEILPQFYGTGCSAEAAAWFNDSLVDIESIKTHEELIGEQESAVCPPYKYDLIWSQSIVPELESHLAWTLEQLNETRIIEQHEELIRDQRPYRAESSLVVSFPNHGVYEGELKNGMRHGQGRYEWPDGCVYEGSWRRNQRHGYGHMICSYELDKNFKGYDYENPNGEFIKYEVTLDGDDVDEKVVGKHTWLPQDEWFGIGVYKGDWVENKRHGRGEFRFLVSSYALGWEGDWFNNQTRQGRLIT
jgi:hypothetical protein